MVEEHIEVQDAQGRHTEQIVNKVAAGVNEEEVLEGGCGTLTRRLVDDSDIGAQTQADGAVHEGDLPVAEV